MNSGYTLSGTLTTIQHNVRIYPPEVLKKAVRDYMKVIKQKERKEKLKKINEFYEANQ